MTKNDLFYADSSHLLGVTSDKKIQRNIERSATRADWTLIGKSNTKYDVAYRYLIPLGNRNKEQAERVFGVKARNL